MIAVMGRAWHNWMLGTVLTLVGVLLALGFAFQAFAAVIGGIVAFIGAATIFFLQRQNELQDVTSQRNADRKRAYTLLIARLRQYRDQLSAMESYFGAYTMLDTAPAAVMLAAAGRNIQQMKAEYVRDIDRRLSELNWPDTLNITWDHARHIDADDIVALERFRMSVSHYSRQILNATENRRQPAMGFSQQCTNGMLTDLGSLADQLEIALAETHRAAHDAPSPPHKTSP